MFLYLIIYIIACLLLSAFFAGMEVAFLSSNRLLAEMETDRGLTGVSLRIIRYFYSHSDMFVSAMQTGRIMILAAYCVLMFECFEKFVFSGLSGLALGVSFAFSILLFLAVVFIARTLFKLSPNRWITLFAIPAFVFYILLWPVGRMCLFVSRIIFKLLGIKQESAKPGEGNTMDELDDLLQSAINNAGEEEIDPEVELFHNALEFLDIKVRDCMIPRTEIDGVNVRDCELAELEQKFIESGHSKLIVYDDDIDNIVGYIHSSEMFLGAKDWRRSVINMPFVPESMEAQKLMKSLMLQKKSLAVVVDEYGGTSGIVSLEDIVEEIFGEIEDEHDAPSLVAKQTGEGEYVLSGRLEIDKVNEILDLNLPEDDDYMTVGGLILHYYHSFPKLNEIVKVNQFEFKIIKKTNTKIELVRLKVSR